MPTLKDGSKPQIFLPEDPAREKAHAANYTKSAAALTQYATLIDAIYPVVLDHVLSTAALDVIALSIDHSCKIVWETAGRYLVTLSHYFPAALERTISLGRSRSSNTRLRVLQSQWRVTLPEPYLTELLIADLTDSSTRVRQFAAGRALTLHRQDLLPLLQQQLANESNPKVICSLQDAIDELGKLAAKGV